MIDEVYSPVQRLERSVHKARWLDIVWLVLMAALAGTLIIDHEASAVPIVQTALIIGLAYLKCRMVVMSFMEVVHAPPLWRTFFEIWLVGVPATILYFMV